MEDGVDEKTVDAWPGKDDLAHHRTGDHMSEIDTKDGDDGMAAFGSARRRMRQFRGAPVAATTRM
jgi:hypothetical protein